MVYRCGTCKKDACATDVCPKKKLDLMVSQFCTMAANIEHSWLTQHPCPPLPNNEIEKDRIWRKWHNEFKQMNNQALTEAYFEIMADPNIEDETKEEFARDTNVRNLMRELLP